MDNLYAEIMFDELGEEPWDSAEDEIHEEEEWLDWEEDDDLE